MNKANNTETLSKMLNEIMKLANEVNLSPEEIDEVFKNGVLKSMELLLNDDVFNKAFPLDHVFEPNKNMFKELILIDIRKLLLSKDDNNMFNAGFDNLMIDLNNIFDKDNISYLFEFLFYNIKIELNKAIKEIESDLPQEEEIQVDHNLPDLSDKVIVNEDQDNLYILISKDFCTDKNIVIKYI